MGSVPTLEQRKLFNAMILHLAVKFLDPVEEKEDTSSHTIFGVADLIKRVVDNDTGRRANVVSWLTEPTGAGLGKGIAIRRAVVASIGENKDDVLAVVQNILGLFGEELYIRHSPVMQQEGE